MTPCPYCRKYEPVMSNDVLWLVSQDGSSLMKATECVMCQGRLHLSAVEAEIIGMIICLCEEDFTDGTGICQECKRKRI